MCAAPHIVRDGEPGYNGHTHVPCTCIPYIPLPPLLHPPSRSQSNTSTYIQLEPAVFLSTSFPPRKPRERKQNEATRASPRITLASIAGFKRVVRQLPRVHFPFCPTAIFLRLEDVFTATDTPLYTSPLPRRRWKTMSRARPRREILKIFHPVSMIDGYGSSSSRVKQPSRDAREYRSIYFLPIRVVKRYGQKYSLIKKRRRKKEKIGEQRKARGDFLKNYSCVFTRLLRNSRMDDDTRPRVANDMIGETYVFFRPIRNRNIVIIIISWMQEYYEGSMKGDLSARAIVQKKKKKVGVF